MIVTLPAQRHLRDIYEKCTALSVDIQDEFHTVVAKLLWIMKRARPNLETILSYFFTRVTKSGEDKWKKLRRLIVYIKCTNNGIRIVGAEDLSTHFNEEP